MQLKKFTICNKDTPPPALYLKIKISFIGIVRRRSLLKDPTFLNGLAKIQLQRSTNPFRCNDEPAIMEWTGFSGIRGLGLGSGPQPVDPGAGSSGCWKTLHCGPGTVTYVVMTISPVEDNSSGDDGGKCKT